LKLAPRRGIDELLRMSETFTGTDGSGFQKWTIHKIEAGW
jgi:hypothetical protein